MNADLYFLCISAFDKLIESNGGQYITPIVWTSDMTNRARHFLNPEDYIIQIWTGGIIFKLKKCFQINSYILKII
jgi:hypothetical protein